MSVTRADQRGSADPPVAAQVIGLGMAVAVLLDATLVRMVATPAVLQVMGRANWWFPARLRSESDN